MRLTHHPFQTVGAHAAAVLAGRDTPSDLTEHDLAALVDRIVADGSTAAVAIKGEPGYAWQLALAACFPNSPPTHPKRAARSDTPQRIQDMFEPDQVDVGPCWFCQQPAGVRWGKDRLPLVESGAYVNTQPAGGHPVCRPCRIAVWCLPYGSAHNGSEVITASSPDSGLEKLVVADLVQRNLSAIRRRWSEWGERLSTTAGRAILRTLATVPAQVDIHQWRNDNRTPFCSVQRIREDVARWYASVVDDPVVMRGLREAAERGRTHRALLLAARDDQASLLRALTPVFDAVHTTLSERGLTAETIEETAPLRRLAWSMAEAVG